MSAILTFLGGSAFRLIWGQVSDYLNARQEHAQELDRMRIQAELDALAFERNQAAIRLQAELGIKTINVQSEADNARIELEGWSAAVAQAQKPSGIKWVDAWNGCVRPAAASIALLLWVLALNAQGWKMTDWDSSLVAVVLGFYFASRVLVPGKS